MIKQTPSIGRIIAMVAFTLSVFAILIFLWLAFGGSVPLKPEGYRFTVHMREAATLAVEADVRMAGVNVGKVKSKELDKGGARTVVEVQLDEAYSPIPKDSRAILRQKTLLGETYLEITPGNKSAGPLDDGGRLANSRVEPTVELDEIFTAFDPDTRKAFKEWVTELAGAIKDGRGQDLNDAFGNFEGFAVDGAKLLQVLDEQNVAVHRLVKNTGVVFGAINERRGALRDLIVNSKRTFEATASRDEALAETFAIFPTFLDETKATMARLEDFSRNTRPLVVDLKAPADDLGPTVRDLGDLAPHLERLFRDLGPLIRASRTGVPALDRTLEEAEPLVEALHTFFPELNPILSYFNFHQTTIAAFITNGGADVNADYGTGQRGQTQIGIVSDRRNFEPWKYGTEPPNWVRGNAYMHPNTLMRALELGTIESFECPGGERTHAEDALDPGEDHDDKRAPCFEMPPSLYDGKTFSIPRRGVAPLRPNPKSVEGNPPARDPDPND
jgi:phospholipid/cholesterol/gamma-HCH transport system substrate-binding protein